MSTIQRSVEHGIERWLEDVTSADVRVASVEVTLGPASIPALAAEVVAALFQSNDVLVATNPKVGQRGSSVNGDTYRFRLNDRQVEPR